MADEIFAKLATIPAEPESNPSEIQWMYKPTMAAAPSVASQPSAPPRPAGGLRAMLQKRLGQEKNMVIEGQEQAKFEQLRQAQEAEAKKQRDQQRKLLEEKLELRRVQQQQLQEQHKHEAVAAEAATAVGSATNAAAASAAGAADWAATRQQEENPGWERNSRRRTKWDDTDDHAMGMGDHPLQGSFNPMAPKTDLQMAAATAEENMNLAYAVVPRSQTDGPAAPTDVDAIVKGIINTPEQSMALASAAASNRFGGGYKPPTSGPPATDWLCRCGFKNTYRNDVCGGNGPMGCKTDKSQGCVQIIDKGPAAAVQAPQSKLKKVPCKFYEQGTCSKGMQCQFFHDPNIDPAIIAAGKAAGKEGKIRVPGCLFLPRVADGIEAYHLQAYFGQFGKLNDIFGPLKKAIAAIAYVRFDDAASADKVLAIGEDHYVKGNLMVRAEQCYEREGKGKGKGPQRSMGEDRGDQPGQDRSYSYGSGGLSVNYREEGRPVCAQMREQLSWN